MFRREEANYYTSYVTALKLGSYVPFLRALGCSILPLWTSRDSQEWHATGLGCAGAVESPVRTGRALRQRAATSPGVLQDCKSEKVQKETGMTFSANHRQVGKRSETSLGDLNTEGWLTGRSLTWTWVAGGGPGAIPQRRSSQVTIYLVSHTCR